MGYVANNLIRDEKIIYQGKIHWFIFVPWIILFLICYSFLQDENIKNDKLIELSAYFFLFFSVMGLVDAFFYKISTELAVTNKRVISKTGFIKRNTVEFNHNKVESFNIEQGIVGRIFGYGSVIINGTGGGRTPIKNIDNPIRFREKAMTIIDQNNSLQSQHSM